MDWIERWFGIAPDSGDGSLELLITLAVVAVAIVAILELHPRTRTAIHTACKRNLILLRKRRSG